MTPDDDAFIRKIVDSPGDDLPRLVYADWLDERDAPRGAYLRAELEWANARAAAGEKKLRSAAKKLDSVWVARVSRPPLGVYCDHLRASATGQVYRREDIEAAGEELGVMLPPQLLALLLNYTLGHLRGGPFILPREDEPRNWVCDAIVCLFDPDFNEDMTSYELLDHTVHLREQEELPEKYAFLAGFSYEIAVVSCRKPDLGSVHHWDAFNGRTHKLASSIGGFLAFLIPRSWPITDDDFPPEND